MPKLNITQTAKHVGLSRTSIYRHIRSGKITAERDQDGNPMIDLSEIERVYGRDRNTRPKPGHPVQVTAQAAEPVQLADLRTQVDFLKLQLEDAKTERDRLLGIIETQTRMITGTKPEPKPGLFARLFGGK